MPDEVITIGIEADISKFNKSLNDAKKNLSGMGSRVKTETKEVQGASKNAEKSSQQVKENMDQSLLAQMSFFPSFKKMGESIKGMKTQFAEAGKAGKIAMAGVGLAVAGVVAGVVVEIAKAVWDGVKQLVAKADPIGFEKVMSGVNASVNKLKSALGNALMPLFLEMSVAIKYIADGLTLVVEGLVYIRSLLYGIMGINLAEEMSKVADSMEDASESANQGLASFDKLTTVGDIDVSGLKESERIAELSQEAYEYGQMAQIALGGWVGELAGKIGNVWDNIQSGASNMWNSIKSTATSVWNSISGGAVDLWNGFKSLGEEAWNGLSSIGSSIFNTLTSIGTTVWTVFSEVGLSVFNTVRTTLSNGFSSIWDRFLESASTVFNVIGGIGRGVWETMSSFAKGVWNTYLDIGKGVINVISDLLKGDWSGVKDTIINVFKSVISTLTNMFNGMWNGITSTFKSIFNGVIGIFNKVIKAYNDTLGSFNVDVLGYNIGLPKIGEIPMLAKGGVAEPNNPFLAVLGDNRREKEIVSPVSEMKNAVREVLGEGYGSDRPVQITINLDGRTVARQIYDPLRQESRRRGVSPII